MRVSLALVAALALVAGAHLAHAQEAAAAPAAEAPAAEVAPAPEAGAAAPAAAAPADEEPFVPNTIVQKHIGGDVLVLSVEYVVKHASFGSGKGRWGG